MPLTLGSVVFTDFEIPEEMPFGGEQMLVVRKLVGGDRVIDAMGRDDDDRSWSGRFRGPLAETRARGIDTLRIQGQQQILGWAGFLYLVVIKSFKPRYSNPQEIPYSITCIVIEDLSNPVLAIPPNPDDAISSDMNAAGLLTPDINVESITGAVSNASNLIANVAGFAGASAGQISGVQTGLQQALATINAQATAQNGVVAASGTVAGMGAGLQPQALAAGLTAQSQAFTQLGSLYQLQALIGRASLNVTNTGS